MIRYTDQGIDVKSETDARETEPAAQPGGVLAHPHKINKTPRGVKDEGKGPSKGIKSNPHRGVTASPDATPVF